MNNVILIFVTLFFLLLNVGVLLWAMSILGSWKAPFVPLPHESLPGIVRALQIAPGNVVYDIGCGEGRVLRACAAQEPHATYIGVERAWFPYILARLSGKRFPISYVRANAFSQQFSSAHRVVLYLLPGLVDEIGRKLVAECAPGTRIVCVDFPFTFLTPSRVIEQHHLPNNFRGRMLYVYEFSSCT